MSRIEKAAHLCQVPRGVEVADGASNLVASVLGEEGGYRPFLAKLVDGPPLPCLAAAFSGLGDGM